MKLVKWLVLSISIIIVTWYAIEFLRYSDYDEKKRISMINGEALLLSVLKVDPDASYKVFEVKISEQTQITGIGFQSFFVNHINDLKHDQKVRVWLTTNADNEYIAEKVVVYNLF